MPIPKSAFAENAVPEAVAALCAQLEEAGLPCHLHGDALWRVMGMAPKHAAIDATAPLPFPNVSVLCQAAPNAILQVLPHAVVTAEGASRFTQATSAGPVDLIPVQTASLAAALETFGLGPFGFAYRPTEDSWCDPQEQRLAFQEGRLACLSSHSNPFQRAPRRYWIAARLLAEHQLKPTRELVDTASEALPQVQDRLPLGASARREMTRVLNSADPTSGLGFLRASGVNTRVFPGTKVENESRIAQLPNLQALRWAAWLRGSSTNRVLVRFRMPHAMAKRIERLQAAHPIERELESGQDIRIRKLLQRFQNEEIEALFTWRRLELKTASPASYAQSEGEKVEAELAELEHQIAEFRASKSHSQQLKALALDGKAVMEALGAGPGRHVGQALTHLAHFVSPDPSRNEISTLKKELFDWAKKNTSFLD